MSRQASLLVIARVTGRLRGGRLGQQRLQLQRRAALGPARRLSEPPERVQVQLARAIAVELGEHLLCLRRVDLEACVWGLETMTAM